MLGLWPVARRPLSSQSSDFLQLGTVAAFYFSDVGVTTSGADTPADTHFDARVRQPLVWRRNADDGQRIGGRASFRAAEIEIDNTDAALNTLLGDFAIDGRAVRVKVGRRGWAYTQFITLFDGTAAGWRRDGRGRVFVAPRGMEFRFTQPVQATRYAGTGGAEGGSDLEGKPKPLAFGGPLNNVPAPLLNADQVLQLHDGSIEGVTAVYDRGVELTLDTAYGSAGDVGSYSALVASTIAPGQYATSRATGYIRLGAPPDGQVTVDFTGKPIGGAFTANAADIIADIARTHGGLAADQIDSGAFNVVATKVSAPIGLWIDTEERTVGDVLDEIVATFEGWWGDSRLGKLQIGRIEIPVGGINQSFDEGDILDFEWLAMPAAVNPAVKTAVVGYQKNYSVQETDLASAISDSRRVFISEEFRLVRAVDSAVGAFHLLAKTLQTDGLWATKAGASTHANHLLSVYGRDARLARMTVAHRGLLLDLGKKIRVTSARFGLSNTRFLVVGVALDAGRNEIELTVYK